MNDVKLSVVPGTQVRDEYTMFNHHSVFFFHFPKTFQPMRTRQLIKYKFSEYKILLYYVYGIRGLASVLRRVGQAFEVGLMPGTTRIISTLDRVHADSSSTGTLTSTHYRFPRILTVQSHARGSSFSDHSTIY